jgi:hypothetical protein
MAMEPNGAAVLHHEIAASALPQAILRAAKKLTGRNDILAKSRKRPIAKPRQALCLAMRLAPEGYSYPAIAALVGLKDHTTVIHGVRAAQSCPDQTALAEAILARAQEKIAFKEAKLDLSSHIRRLNRRRKRILRHQRQARAIERHKAAQALYAKQREYEMSKRPIWEHDTPEGRYVASRRAIFQHTGVSG